MSGSAADPIHIPDWVWEQNAIALRARDVGALFHLAKKYAGASQNRIAAATGIPQSRVNALMRRTAGPVEKLQLFDAVADGLNMPDDARVLLGLAPRRPKSTSAQERLTEPTNAADDINALTAWLNDSRTSDETIDRLSETARSLALHHTQSPAREMLPQVLSTHRSTQALLHTNKLSLTQRTSLYRVNAELLSHACMLFGDVNADKTAESYGSAAVHFAQEAGSGEAHSWSALAKTARWQSKYKESADSARRGYHCSQRTPLRVQLAYYEANASALQGDAERAREALRRAEEAADVSFSTDPDTSVWSFSTERQALFALSVATRVGEPETALRAVAMADAGWAAGDPYVPTTWAQIRIGAGVAQLMQDNLDGAKAEVEQMLSLPPELRMATVTRYLAELDMKLKRPRFALSEIAIDLRQQIRQFNSGALPDRPGTGDNS